MRPVFGFPEKYQVQIVGKRPTRSQSPPRTGGGRNGVRIPQNRTE